MTPAMMTATARTCEPSAEITTMTLVRDGDAN
jgi:hypothetical protein